MKSKDISSINENLKKLFPSNLISDIEEKDNQINHKVSNLQNMENMIVVTYYYLLKNFDFNIFKSYR